MPIARMRAPTSAASRRGGETAQAEQDLRAAIALDPLFVPAYINLADMYRAQGREADVERVLRDGLRQAPKSAALHHVLGLDAGARKAAMPKPYRSWPRRQRSTRRTRVTLTYMASRCIPPDARGEAIAMLVSASAKHPADTDILAALASFYRDRGDVAEAQRYTERLRTVDAGL